MSIIGNLFSGISSFKLITQVHLSGSVATTFTVPSGQIFKGMLACATPNSSNDGIVLRENNSSGNIVGGGSDVAVRSAGGSDIGQYITSKYHELGQGTYYVISQSAAASTTAVIGGFYANA